jgi:predicted nucleotidyltransferase
VPLEFDPELARRFVAHAAPDHDVLLVGLTGAHAYGFPSEDSDYDLKGVMLLPLASMLGIDAPTDTFDRMEIFEGVEQDLTLHDAKKAIHLLLRGNGNVLEHALTPVQLYESDRAAALRTLVRAAVSKRFVHHYRGFFHRMREEHARERRAKTLLYAYRVALTGAHLLTSGELEQNVRVNAARYGITEVEQLVRLKRERSEKSVLTDEEDASLSASLERAGALLEAAHEASPLPPDAPNRDALDRWLVGARLASRSLVQSG